MSKVETVTLNIEGMTCASCVARVEKAIIKAQGVKNVSINLANEKATLSIDKDNYNFEEVKKFIEEAGYEVKSSENESITKALFNSKTNIKLDKAKNEFITSLIFTIPVFALNMAMMSDSFISSLNLQHNYITFFLFVLTFLLIIISGRKFYIQFAKNLSHLTFDMNSLISIGTGSAFLFSAIVTFFPFLLPENLQKHVYYDTTAVIISLILLGRWLEAKAKFKTNEAINELVKIQPQKALVKLGNTEIEKHIDDLRINDIVIIKPGQNIPTDGIVVEGFSTIDESIVTGESIPVEKSAGSKVKSGSVNKTGYIEYRVTTNAANSTLGQIIRLMEQSQAIKAPIQKTADKISSVFVPIVISIAIISLIVWYFTSNKLDVALVNFISVLIIACPCALGLAIPTALIVGIGGAAKKGILIRDGNSLELFHKVSTIFFDKTGTLTSKELKVESYKLFDFDIKTLLEFIIPAEKKSEHPVAQAIISFSKNFNLNEKAIEHFESKTGLGIEAVVEGKEVVIGNRNFLKSKFEKEIDTFSGNIDSHSEVFVLIDKKLEAVFKISEEIKPEASEIIKNFSNSGIRTFILSGDKIEQTKRIAEKCGVTAFESELLPEDKLNIIKKFQAKGEIVAFIGDGINDAPSITQADVGIAMGSGTDIAILSGSVILLNDNLNNILLFKKISKKVDTAIKQNLFWAFIYNVIGIPLAAFGLLNPIFAAFAMSMSSVSVVSNSLRVKKNI
jgi:Cu+-exporting ATPase